MSSRITFPLVLLFCVLISEYQIKSGTSSGVAAQDPMDMAMVEFRRQYMMRQILMEQMAVDEAKRKSNQRSGKTPRSDEGIT